jgi:formylglycine-generating enzyme required for sulfatase activity
MTQFTQIRSGHGVVAGTLRYPALYVDARKGIEVFAQMHGLRVNDMPMGIRAITSNALVREIARPDYVDFITTEYQGLRNGSRSYEVWHSTGSLSTVVGLEKAFTSRDKYRFMDTDDNEWLDAGAGRYAGKDVVRLENVDDLRKGRDIPNAGTPYMCALLLPADFEFIPANADEKTAMEQYRSGKPFIFEAAQLKSWQFRLDDRVLCACGSPENREALANLIFNSKEEGGEGWSVFGSHHNISNGGFNSKAIGRPLFFYNNNTGICGRVYGYGNFMASKPELLESSGSTLDFSIDKMPALDPVLNADVKPGNMVFVKGGSFYMGSADDEIYHGDDQPGERPRHKVTLDGFYIDATTVTQREYTQVTGTNPAVAFKGDNMPAVNVTWNDAVLFCNARSKRDGLEPVYSYTKINRTSDGGCKSLENITVDFGKNGYRLPTEAEWECSCRAGTQTRFFWGDEIDGSYGWSEINTDPVLRPCGQKKPNAWGIFDMAGNVQEWCNDWFDGGYYAKSSEQNPRGPDSGQLHVLRGGSNYRYKDRDRLRSANRSCNVPDSHGDMCGFRTVRSSS